MRIAYFTQTVSVDNGAGRYAKNIIDGAKKGGNDVSVFTEFGGGGTSILSRSFNSVFNLWRLRRAVKNYDVVHALDVWPHGVYGLISVLGTNKKLFLSGVGTYSVAPLDSRLKGFLMRLVLRKAEKIFCISKYVKTEIDSRMRGANTEVVHMGLSQMKRLDENALKAYEEKYSLNGYDPVVLTVGAPKERKGQLDTLKSINLLKTKYPKILYVMVGPMYETAYIAEIEKFARDNEMENNIRLVGDALGDGALSFFYNVCDVFVMNSNNSHGHFEGFGLVFLEAASFGKPVVGSLGCGIEDAIDDGSNGYLAKQGDHKDIAKKIDMAIQNRAHLGSKSLDFVKKFSWQRTVEKYLEFYRM